MRVRLIILFSFLTFLATAQDNPNGLAYKYTTLAEAIARPMDANSIVEVSEKGLGGPFTTRPKRIGEVADTIFSYDKPDGTLLIRDTAPTQALNVQWAGMVADGVTDNYKAYRRLINYVNLRGGHTTLYFPPGDYYIDTLRIIGGVNANGIQNMEFQNCRNLKIIGYGAKISVKGNFRRVKDNGANSFENIVCPLIVSNSTNVTIEGLELDGNVDLMTKDAGVGESVNHGLRIQSSVNVHLANLFVHHFATDGVYIATSNATPGVACQNLTAVNVRSYYNARQGMSVIQLHNGTFENCEFSFTGKTSTNGDTVGGYGFHPPRHGVDVEPNRGEGDIDVLTGDLHFNNCKFIGNAGSTIGSALPFHVRDIFINGGVLDASDNVSGYAIIMGVYNFNIANARINTGNASIYPTWSIGANQKSSIRNCVITTKASGIVATVAAEFGCLIENNDIIGQHDSTFHSNMPYLASNTLTFRGNRVFYDSVAYGDDNKGLVQNVALAENNTYSTNLDSTKQVTINYGTAKVRNEKYPVNHAIMPFGAGNWDFNKANFTRGDVAIGERQIMFNSGQEMTFSAATGIPTSGTYKVGDRVWTKNPASAGWNMYVCTVAGTAGVDAVFMPVGEISTGTGGSKSIINNPDSAQNGRFNVYFFGGGNRIANYNQLVSVPVPNSALEITTRNATGYYNALTLSQGGATSGMTIGAPGSNLGQLVTGGYANSAPGQFRALSTAMTALRFNNGVYEFRGKTGLTTGIDDPLDMWMHLNSTGVSLDGTATTSTNLKLKPSTTAISSLRVPITGAALPSAPTNGDFASDGTSVYVRQSNAWVKMGGVVTSLTTTGTTGAATLTNGVLNIPQYAGGTGGTYTDAQARAAISLTTTGTSGAATYNPTTGVLNIPQYAGGTGGTTLNGTGFVKMSGTTPSYQATITNADLANNFITINGTNVPLGGSINIATGGGTGTDTTTCGMDGTIPVATGPAPTVTPATSGVTATVDGANAAMSLVVTVAPGTTVGGTLCTIHYGAVWGGRPVVTITPADAAATLAASQGQTAGANATLTNTINVVAFGLSAGTYTYNLISLLPESRKF